MSNFSTVFIVIYLYTVLYILYILGLCRGDLLEFNNMLVIAGQRSSWEVATSAVVGSPQFAHIR